VVELPSAARVTSLIAGWRSANDVPGVVVGMRLGDREPLIVADGEDVGSGAALPPDASFELASITKTFTGALALDLVDEGRLGLDDPIDAYVEGFPNADQITVRQLLTHTSGLYPAMIEVGETPYSEEILEVLTRDLEHSYTPEESLELVKDRPLKFPPGQGVQYSNVNTTLLGEVIEDVTGSDLGTAYRERLLDPNGLEATYYRPTEDGQRPVRSLYRRDDGEIASTADFSDVAPLSFMGAAVGMVSTPEDLLDWGVMFLRDGALGTADLAQSRFQVAPNGTALGVIPWSIDSGACIFGGCSGDESFDAVTGIGLLVGTSSMVAYFPQWDLTVVAFSTAGYAPEVEQLVATILKSTFEGH
jgi:D-alanyl-D-alanine carboxypeptidase